MSARLTDLSELSLQHALLTAAAPTDIVAWRGGRPITVERFLYDVHAVIRRLSAVGHVINLCEDRYAFLVAFAGALTAQRTTLLPPNRNARVIEDIARDYPGAHPLRDPDVAAACAQIDMCATDIRSPDAYPVPLIARDHLAAIVFTSGSTGRARPNLKYWGDLVTGSRIIRQRFGFGINGTTHSVVATVPPQHMYGFEMSVLNPLINRVSVHTGAAFFPADICAALESVPAPRVLVTTPFHMRACLDAGLSWPAMHAVISATAPLSSALASRAEETFGCPVLEIYGCTEAGSMASRRTVEGDDWRLFEGTRLKHTADGHSVCGAHLPDDVPLHDVVESLDRHRFVLHGRHTDMINVAGKRASLADLNIKLQEIDGVADGVFLMPESGATQGVTRLVAFAVSPTLDASAIRRALAMRIDPAFLPRPLYVIEKMPRNETGKLTRAALLNLLTELRRSE